MFESTTEPAIKPCAGIIADAILAQVTKLKMSAAPLSNRHQQTQFDVILDSPMIVGSLPDQLQLALDSTPLARAHVA